MCESVYLYVYLSMRQSVFLSLVSVSRSASLSLFLSFSLFSLLSFFLCFSLPLSPSSLLAVSLFLSCSLFLLCEVSDLMSTGPSQTSGLDSKLASLDQKQDKMEMDMELMEVNTVRQRMIEDQIETELMWCDVITIALLSTE